MHRFIHIPKNAGTSVRQWVYPMNYKDTDEELPEYIKDVGLDKHLPYCKLNKKARFVHQFAVVRNPWARVVSLYHEKRHPHTEPMSFLTFIHKLKDFTYDGHWWCNPPHKCFANQIDWLSISSVNSRYNKDTIQMLEVLPFNNLQINLQKYLGHQVFLNHLNRGHVLTNYKSFYNDFSKKMVAEHFERDIEHFGFKFETEATKNVWTA